MLRRLLKSRSLRRFLVGSILFGVAGIALCTVTFIVVASRAQLDFRPVQEPISTELRAFIDKTDKYQREESSTYLTFPEWYLVFNPQEYGQFLHDHPPSQFPYFKSIGQFWRGYAEVYGITKRHYRPNFGDQLMVVVIGTSTTVEYVIKGVYENTVGRLSECSGAQTAEEVYAAQVAREYGEFIPTQPWFDFPFGRKLTDLWTTTEFFGPHFLRKCERKFFLGLEYGVKVIYAAVLRLASHSVYGVADDEVYTSVTNIPEDAFANANVKRIKQLAEHSWIISVPHYQGFTDTVPELARQGVDFSEIAGNDEILVTVVAPTSWKFNLSEGKALFTMELLNDAKLQRVAIQAPVKSLGRILREIETKGIRVEHLFDY